MANTDYLDKRKIIGVFDFDITGVEKFNIIKNNTYWKVAIEGDKFNGLYKKRNDHPCFFAMLIPVPKDLENLAGIEFPSFIEIENLLPKEFLKLNNFVTEEITTGNTSYLKMKGNKKCILWEKALELEEEGFNNFKPLFSKINFLFNI
jgi:hypothetical protein